MWHRTPQNRALREFTAAVVLSMVASAGLFAYLTLRTGERSFTYLLWNLFLAAVPLVFAMRLVYVLRQKRWSDWEPIIWTLLWILFLPNSFYMVSDYIHLEEVADNHILYIAVLFTSFIFLGLVLGFASLCIVHRALRRRLPAVAAGAWIAALLLVCSFAIYIGRDLRWNSWDVIINPGGLLFDVSDRLLRPAAYPDMLEVVGSFFVLLTSLYAVVWAGVKLLHPIGMHVRTSAPEQNRYER